MSADFAAAREFLYREGRLLERRQFEALFEGRPASGVVDALRGYQNDDGGFGHALEPDKRCPDSLPIDVELALQTLVEAGATDETMVQRACDYLASVAAPNGALAIASPVIEAYPRADEWGEWTYQPGVFPTAGIAGVLHQMKVDHRWLPRATDYCWSEVEAGVPEDAHAVAQVFVFLEHVPDRDRAAGVVPAFAEGLQKATWYRGDAEDPSYGVSPLHIAATPGSPWYALFGRELLDSHLDRLERDQLPDGGWSITWEPPSAAATFEYRGVETVRALRVLAAYGRLTPR